MSKNNEKALQAAIHLEDIEDNQHKQYIHYAEGIGEDLCVDDKSNSPNSSSSEVKPFGYYMFIKVVDLLIAYFIKDCKGLYNIPQGKGALLIANHGSYIDHFIIGSFVANKLKRKLHFVAKKEHFLDPFNNWLHRFLGGIPVDRENFKSQDFQSYIDVINSGKLLVIYPEGTRTPDGKMKRFKKGFIKIQEFCECDIIPIGLVNTYDFLPKSKKLPKLKKALMSMVVGEPVKYDHIKNYTSAEKLVYYQDAVKELIER